MKSFPVLSLEQKLDDLKSGAVMALCTVLDLRDLETGVHATRLAEWAVRVGELFGMTDQELRDLEYAALLHDVGKIGVPDSVLNKPGRLTEDEFDQMKQHSELGWSVLRLIPGFERVSLYVLHHHERMDGRGYPSGLAGDDIPLASRIVSVVDAFDAMVSSRPYRPGLPVEEAFRRLRADSRSQFDEQIVDLFVPIVEASLDDLAELTESPQVA